MKFGERAFSDAGPSIWNSLPDVSALLPISDVLNLVSGLIILTFILIPLRFSIFIDSVTPYRSPLL